MKKKPEFTEFDRLIADAIIGIDTLWGGDALHPSGTRRFIADSWFSSAPLPRAYTHPAAVQMRETEGVSAKEPDRQAIEAYIAAVDIPATIGDLRRQTASLPPLRRCYVEGLITCFEVMWDLAMEVLGKGDPVDYDRCVRASTGSSPQPSDPEAKRRRVEELIRPSGQHSSRDGALCAAVDTWRAKRSIGADSIAALSSEYVAEFNRLARKNLLPYLPEALHTVPMANIRFIPIENAWFSGSMNYMGRERKADGTPEYEANYEINASLQISVPEFKQLISHEVVPGHVTTFAFLQNLYERGEVGFEATVLTMNTPGAALFEGVANNAILIAHNVTEVDQLSDPELQMGVLLALLQDDAKNQASYLTWKEGMEQKEVAAVLRRDYLVSEERAQSLSGPWARNPLLGRMYLPAYRTGTERVAELRRKYPPERVLPALYGCSGLVDVITVGDALNK